MPSRAVYTALAAATSDTGCSTVLIPWVEEPVMVTPEVVGVRSTWCVVHDVYDGHASCGPVARASRFLTGSGHPFRRLRRHRVTGARRGAGVHAFEQRRRPRGGAAGPATGAEQPQHHDAETQPEHHPPHTVRRAGERRPAVGQSRPQGLSPTAP